MKDLEVNEAKEKYESIKASQKLRKKVDKIFEPKKNNFKIVLGIVATVAVCFVVTLNANPTFAKSIATNDFMKSLVSVLTANRFEFSDNNMEAQITTAKITGIADKEVEAKINKELEDISNALIEQFKIDSEKLKEFDETAHMGIESDYIIRTNTDDILAVDVYVVNTVGSSSTSHKFYNVDKKTGEVITLESRFKNNEDYLMDISKYIEAEMNRQTAEDENKVYFADADSIYNILLKKQEFYINENNNVVIVFDKYEVAPGSMGSPEFEINL